MIEPEVKAAAEILRRHDIRYVVIGGQAIARTAATTTHDIDVMVATADFSWTLARLRTDAALAFDWEDHQLARFRIRTEGGVPLDIINSSAFAGDATGAEFFRFLSEEGSTESDGISYATPEVVWYTRLLTKRWKAYAEKIITNVIDGVAATRLGEVEDIGRRFGMETKLRERVAYVREELARPEVASLIRAR